MRLFVFLIGIAALVFLASGGHLLFIPFLILPFGWFALPRRKRSRAGALANRGNVARPRARSRSRSVR